MAKCEFCSDEAEVGDQFCIDIDAQLCERHREKLFDISCDLITFVRPTNKRCQEAPYGLPIEIPKGILETMRAIEAAGDI